MERDYEPLTVITSVKYGKKKVGEKIIITINKNQVTLPLPFIREYQLKEVVFDYRNLILREPTIDDKKTYKITRHQFGGGFPSEITGHYEVEKDGDDFLLKRI